MSITVIHKNINQGKISSLYLLFGVEPFLIEETKHKIIQASLSEEELDFNYSSFDLQEVPIDLVLDEAETLPFMGDRRVVIVNNPMFLTAQRDKSKVDHDLKRFESYLENPSQDTVMVIHAPYEKLDERKKIVKLLKKNSEVLHATEMNDAMLLEWIENKAKQQGVSISSTAKQNLLHLVGPKLMMLTNEMEKLALYVQKGGTIDDDHITQLVSRTLEQNIFVLLDSIVKRKLTNALRIYYDLLQQKEEPIKILSLIANQFRLIYQVKLLTQKGYGQKQIAGMLKVHPFRVKLAGNQGSSFNDKELLWILNEVAESDYKMKTGKMDKKLVLELFLMKLNSEH